MARLSRSGLKANDTPETVAYNFVDAILDGDYQRMLSYMDAEAADVFETIRQMNGYADYTPFFSECDSKSNILGVEALPVRQLRSGDNVRAIRMV